MKIWIEKLTKHKNLSHYQSVSTTKFIFVCLFVVTAGWARGICADSADTASTSERAVGANPGTYSCANSATKATLTVLWNIKYIIKTWSTLSRLIARLGCIAV